jgi:DNA-directed RNA polymerase specialized sigma24 family protein
VLGDRHAAEDAFQATFLVLARKAASIARPEQLAN